MTITSNMCVHLTLHTALPNIQSMNLATALLVFGGYFDV